MLTRTHVISAIATFSFLVISPAIAKERSEKIDKPIKERAEKIDKPKKADKPVKEKAEKHLSSDTKQALTKGTVIGARAGAGAAIGGTAGKVIGGGAVGTGVGIVLTPSTIGCGPNELCKQDTK